MSRDELVVGLMRLAALPGARDGHTAIYPFDMHARPLHVFPLRLYDLDGGLYALAGRSAPKRSVGKRLVTSIAGTARWTRLSSSCGRSCRTTTSRACAGCLPEYVDDGGGAPRPRRWPGTAPSSTRSRAASRPSSTPSRPRVSRRRVGSALAPPPTNGDPVWLRSLEDSQWLTTLEGERVVYLGYRITTDATDDVAARLAELASPASVRRVDRRRSAQSRRQQPRRTDALLGVLASPAISEKLVLLTGRPDVLGRGELRRGRRARDEGPHRRRACRAARRASGATRHPIALDARRPDRSTWRRSTRTTGRGAHVEPDVPRRAHRRRLASRAAIPCWRGRSPFAERYRARRNGEHRCPPSAISAA